MSNHESLSPQVFYILLALATKDRHGYDIMRQVEIDSMKKIKLGPGTLYGAIKRMLEEHLIKEINMNSTRRKTYRLTKKGRSLFSKELKRYKDVVMTVRNLNLLYV